MAPDAQAAVPGEAVKEGHLAPLPLLLTALQHIAVIAPIGLVFPLLVLRAAGADLAQQKAVICASLLALGAGSLLLCWRGRAFGSGFLAPSVFTAAYLPASIVAAQTGGLPLVFGMTIFAGLCEIGFSFALRRLRPFFPVEIAGLAVVMIGLILGLLGFRLLLGLNDSGEFSTGKPDPTAIGLGILALCVTVACNIWGKGPLRLFSVLVGLVVSYPLAVILHTLDGGVSAASSAGGVIALPSLPLVLPSFDLSLVPPFLIGALACALRATGDITTCQKIVDPKWVRPDLGSIERGVRADGLGTALAGALGTVGLNTFSGSIGLSQATGLVQRRIGYAIAGLFTLMAFLPVVVDLAIAMPGPLTGAVLIFSSAFILANGLGIIVARLLDSRRILAVGTALIFGISHDTFADFYQHFPLWAQSLSSSSLVVAMVTAVILNAVFRIGVKQSATLQVPLNEETLPQITTFCREQGALWGARRDVMDRVANALTEAGELALAAGPRGTPLTLRLKYDEYWLVADVQWAGQENRARGDVDEATALEMRLMQHFADKFRFTETGATRQLHLSFDT